MSDELGVILCGIPQETDPVPADWDGVSCPKCKTQLEMGYGLAGGGMGTYWACDTCDFFHKKQDLDE